MCTCLDSEFKSAIAAILISIEHVIVEHEGEGDNFLPRLLTSLRSFPTRSKWQSESDQILHPKKLEQRKSTQERISVSLFAALRSNENALSIYPSFLGRPHTTRPKDLENRGAQPKRAPPSLKHQQANRRRVIAVVRVESSLVEASRDPMQMHSWSSSNTFQ